VRDPAGNGNDFVRTVGIPIDPIDALDVLMHGTTRTIDVGRVAEDRCVVNGLGVGIDAQVARDVLKMERLRGVPAYLTAAVKEVFRFKAFPITLTAEDWNLEFKCLSLGIANGPFCGGGFKLAPLAKVDDGRIDVAAVGDFPDWSASSAYPRLAPANTWVSRASINRQVESVTVSSPSKLVAHVDGEPYKLPRGAVPRRGRPNALRVLVPA